MADKSRQRIAVFEQNGSGEAKIAGIQRHGGGRFRLERVAIDPRLPPMLDDTSDLLPREITADLVLDFLRHPDLSQDLALLCERRSVPMIAPGRRLRYAVTPPT